MDPKIKAELALETQSAFHKSLLDKCKKLVDFSHNHMSRYYSTWDEHDRIYRGERQPDEDDKKAGNRGEPIKMVVPMTHAQINTFVAFCYQIYTHRPSFFELEGMGGEDQQGTFIGEALLERDLQKSNFRGQKLHQFLLDIARFGLGVLKYQWVHETEEVEGQQEVPIVQPGVEQPGVEVQTVTETKTTFMGNRVDNVSPYNFYPDVRMPLTRFAEGEFCASDETYSKSELQRMEKDGLISGFKWVKEAKGDFSKQRRAFSQQIADGTEQKAFGLGLNDIFCLTECQIWLNPKDFELEDGTKMGPEDYPILYVVWYINDQRIVRCEPMNYPSNGFTFKLSQLSPDQERLLNSGISDDLGLLQDALTWFLNSRISSVRKVIDNKFIVDPSGLELRDMEERSPILRLKPAAYRSGVDRWIKQLDVQDVTQSHIQDMKVLNDIAQQTTGISENLMGQHSAGRRSATQDQNVAAGAASRIRMTATLIWYNGLEPLGQDMLLNHRTNLDAETLVKVIGSGVMDPVTGGISQGVVNWLNVTKDDICANYDFRIFDGTLPSEKAYLAQNLQEILTAVIANPMAAGILGYDPRLVLDYIMRLRGIKGTEQLMFPKPIRDQFFNIVLASLYGQAMPTTPQGGPPNGGEQTPAPGPQSTPSIAQLVY